ncbi:MAG: CotH kinase family protein [Clostridia bacterium]|nr:CotH kinase family protein [Clostridia bacterium]
MKRKISASFAVIAACAFLLASFAGCAPCDHNYVLTSTQASTCQTQGKDIYTCEKCSGTKNEALPLGDHDYECTSIKEASFWDEGEGIYDCKYCDDSFQDKTPSGLSTSGIPSLHFTFSSQADFQRMSTTSSVSNSDETEPTVAISYKANGHDSKDFEGYATMKFQGQTSRQYAKKNYNIKLFKDAELEEKNKIELNEDWGKQNKYCLKANWTDFGHSRNLMASRLWAQMVATRAGVNPLLMEAANKGAMDGFPVVVYLNDQYWGMYTLNTAKDEWAFNMDDNDTEGIMYMSKSNDWSKKVTATMTEPWEIEYNGRGDEETEWMTTSFNSLIDLVNNKSNISNTAWKQQIATKLDVNAMVDWMIFSTSINAWDNYIHNTLFATYDGKVWIPCMYDLDQTFGRNVANKQGNPGDYIPYFSGDKIMMNAHKHTNYVNNDPLWNKFYELFRPELYARYTQLRKSTLTSTNITQMFTSWSDAIPQEIRNADYNKWSSKNQPYASYYNKIGDLNKLYTDYMGDRLVALDGFYETLGNKLK